MQGISSKAAGRLSSNYKFNGGVELEEATQLYSTFYRQYDQQLGRFSGVDIRSEELNAWSTYQFGYNDPIAFNDPYGDKASYRYDWSASDAAIGQMQQEYINTQLWEGILSAAFGGGQGGGGGGGGSAYNSAWDRIFEKVDELEKEGDDVQGVHVRSDEKTGGFYASIGYFGPNNANANSFRLWLPELGGKESLIESIWNSSFVRSYIPDKISFSIGGDLAAYLGVGAQPVNFSILTRGKNPGIYMTPSFNVNAGYGTFISAGFNLTLSNYTGDPRNITDKMLDGQSYGIIANGGYLGDFSIGGSYSPVGPGDGFVNVTFGFGAGEGVFVGGQYQYTPGHGPLWEWKK
jgi:RHS repeat-associated protein